MKKHIALLSLGLTAMSAAARTPVVAPTFYGDDDHGQVMAELKRIEGGLRAELKSQMDEIRAKGETDKATRDELAKLEKKHDEAQAKLAEIEAKMGRVDLAGGDRSETKSIGRQFVDSAEYKAAREAGEYRTKQVEVKALDSSNASVGTMIRADRRPGIVRANERARVRDLLASGTTSSNAVEFAQEKLFTNNAAAVAENAARPESTVTFEIKSESVKTLAHILVASRQLLADESALASYIDTRLADGLGQLEDAQLLFGDGTGQNLRGLMTTAEDFTRHTAGDTKIDTLRRAMTDVRKSEYAADGIVLSPEDWEDIELAKGSDNRYLWISVTEGGQPRLMRVPVVDTTAMQEDNFLVGSFRMGAQLLDREQTTIRVSDSDQDNFRKGLITIIAEERLVLVTYRPKAFRAGTFTDPTP